VASKSCSRNGRGRQALDEAEQHEQVQNRRRREIAEAILCRVFSTVVGYFNA
jgi:hypothetical protein